MKNTKPKPFNWISSAIVCLALSTSLGFCTHLSPITVDTYDNATSISNHTWIWYGGATWSWDSSQDHTGNGGGSIHISHLAASGDTIIVPETFAPGSGIWWGGTPLDLSIYPSISCWFKWDTANSTMSIATFNTEGTGGFSIGYSTSAAWDQLRLPNQPVATDAGTVWQHFTFPLSYTMPNINQVNGIEYVDSKPAPWSGDVAFWVDDVIIDG